MDQYSSTLRRENERLQAELAEVTKERDEAQGCCIEGSAELNALAPQVEQLREALVHHIKQTRPIERSTEALALPTKPAEEIIAAHDAEVIERCIKTVTAFRGLGYRDDGSDAWKGHDNAVSSIASALRALIAAPKPGESKEVG